MTSDKLESEQNGCQEGSAAIISQNFGAGRYRRALKIFYATVIVNVILGAAVIHRYKKKYL